MGMQIGIVGNQTLVNPLFNAATEAHAEIANYPFTTIDANHGVMYVRNLVLVKNSIFHVRRIILNV